MRNWLIESYLNPTSHSYQFIQFINCYIYVIILILPLFIMLYPIMNSGYIYYQNKQLEQSIIDSHQELVNKQKLLTSIEKHYLEQYQKSQQFADMDLNIKNVLQENKIEIDYIQWYFEPYKRIDIGLNGRSADIFNILSKLNQLDYLLAQEINLIKLYQEKKVRLNASFVIQE